MIIAPPENFVINGNFDLWQRGNSTGANGGYAADRWRNVVAGGASQTINRQIANLTTLVTDYPTYHIRVTVAGISDAASIARLDHRIESVRTLANKTITVSFWGRRMSGDGSPKVRLIQNFGSGGTPSSAVTAAEFTPVFTDTLQRFVFSAKLPGISDKTIGTNNNDSLTLTFVGTQGTGFNQTLIYDISQVDLFDGIGARPYQRIPFDVTSRRCNRFCQKSFACTVTPAQNVGVDTGEYIFPATSAGATAQLSPSVRLMERTLGVPSMTLFNPAVANAQVRNITRNEDCSASSVSNVSASGFVITATGSAGTQVGDRLGVHWLAHSEIFGGFIED